MRRIILIFCLILLGQSVWAQEQAAPRNRSVQFGFRAGLNGSKTSEGFGPAATTKDPSLKLGLLAGVAVQVPLSSALRLQPEISYSGEGSLQEGLIGSPGDNNYVLVFTTKLHLINLPVLLQYNKGKGFYAETGPQLGFLLDAQLKNEFPPAGQPKETKIKDLSGTNLQSPSFSWVAGTGYTFPSGLGLGLRYTAGLSNYVTGVNDQKVSNIQLHLLYWFGKKTK